jgi:hypothetical protein
MAEEAPDGNEGTLPQPGPGETLRLLRDGARPAPWRRLLPPSLVSLGVHGLIVAGALLLTVRFADRFAIPAAPSWNSTRAELGNDPHNFLLIYPEKEPLREVTVAAGSSQGIELVPQANAAERLSRPDKPGGGPSANLPKWDDRSPKPMPDAGGPAPAKRAKSAAGKRVVRQPADSVPGDNRHFQFNYVPTPPKVVTEMLRLANVQADDVVFDLGCGDARVLTAASQQFGAQGYGYDVDPNRVAQAVQTVKSKGLQDRIVIEYRDIFKLDLSQADVVTLYLFPITNLRLLPQIDQMKPGARIVSHDFDLGDDIVPDQVVDIEALDDWGNTRTHRIYLFTTPLTKRTGAPGGSATGGRLSSSGR